jgi:hypothetical protein
VGITELTTGDWRLAIDGLTIGDRRIVDWRLWGEFERQWQGRTPGGCLLRIRQSTVNRPIVNRQSVDPQSAFVNPSIGNRQSATGNDRVRPSPSSF